MTKERPPLTVENALFKVLGAIGIERAAEITGRATDYLRSLSDPDTRYRLTVDDALLLDLEHMAQGHDGAPIYETYTLRLEQAHATRFTDNVELARRTAKAIRESAEAEEALVLASLPGATSADRAHARKEVEESIRAKSATLPLLEDPP